MANRVGKHLLACSLLPSDGYKYSFLEVLKSSSLIVHIAFYAISPCQ